MSVIGDGLRRSCGKHARLRGDHDEDDETMHSQRMRGVDRGGHIAWCSIRSAALSNAETHISPNGYSMEKHFSSTPAFHPVAQYSSTTGQSHSAPQQNQSEEINPVLGGRNSDTKLCPHLMSAVIGVSSW